MTLVYCYLVFFVSRQYTNYCIRGYFSSVSPTSSRNFIISYFICFIIKAYSFIIIHIMVFLRIFLQIIKIPQRGSRNFLPIRHVQWITINESSNG